MNGGKRRPGAVSALMSGPLTPHEMLVRESMMQAGYAPSSVLEAARAMRRLSEWMCGRNLAAGELASPVIEQFLADRRSRCRNTAASRRGINAVLRALREAGVVPETDLGVATERELLLEAFRCWLRAERGLAAESVRCYSGQAAKFLAGVPDPLEGSLAVLDAAAVTAFIVAQARSTGNVWSAKAQITATRALLRFLHVQGMIPAPLTAAVPGVAGWRLAELPRGLTREQVQSLLAAHDTTTTVGLRDHALLVMLARLGMRGAEAAALRLSDVDWRGGQLVVRGKGARVERLPLQAEVGAALAAYLIGARPACDCATLFVTVRAPFQPLTATAVRAVMGRACRRAGMPRVGAHRLRHSLATDLLRAGAPLAEIGQVLRHRSQLSTAVYAKVDYDSLRTLVLPWPGSAR
jgi:integrase/recombinase XerD